MTPEEKNEYNRRWRAAHPDYYRGTGPTGYYQKYGAAYVAAHAEQVRLTKKRWYQYRTEAARMRAILLL